MESEQYKEYSLTTVITEYDSLDQVESILKLISSSVLQNFDIVSLSYDTKPNDEGTLDLSINIWLTTEDKLPEIVKYIYEYLNDQ